MTERTLAIAHHDFKDLLQFSTGSSAKSSRYLLFLVLATAFV